MTPAQALQTAYLPAAAMLNYNWVDQIGSVEKGKFADLIAVAGNPLADLTEMQRSIRDEGRPPCPERSTRAILRSGCAMTHSIRPD